MSQQQLVKPLSDAAFMDVLNHALRTGLDFVPTKKSNITLAKKVITVDVVSDPN